MGQLHLPHDSGSCTEVLAVTKYNAPPTQSAVLIMSRDIEAASVATPPPTSSEGVGRGTVSFENVGDASRKI